jgi:hypothetical protein
VARGCLCSRDVFCVPHNWQNDKGTKVADYTCAVHDLTSRSTTSRFRVPIAGTRFRRGSVSAWMESRSAARNAGRTACMLPLPVNGSKIHRTDSSCNTERYSQTTKTTNAASSTIQTRTCVRNSCRLKPGLRADMLLSNPAQRHVFIQCLFCLEMKGMKKL